MIHSVKLNQKLFLVSMFPRKTLEIKQNKQKLFRKADKGLSAFKQSL